MTNYEEIILDYVNSLPIIDSHEHLPGHENERETHTDVLEEFLIHYFSSDLRAMGLTEKELSYVRNQNKPLMERWDLVEPYWNLARNTGYGRALDIAAKAIYGVPRVERNTLEELNEKFMKTLEPGAQHYKRILKDMSKIEYSVLDSDLECDKTYFRSVYNIQDLVMVESWDFIEELEQNTGVPITCFDEWLKACTTEIDMALKQGAVALKCPLAYYRSLRFDSVEKQDAERCFNDILIKKTRPSWNAGRFGTTKAFQDYTMHHILRMANERGLVFQFHTGLLEGNNNNIANSDPTLLSNLFVQYPNVKFDLFHISYPYHMIAPALAKMFPNVYLDMCWAHIISPAACISALDEWLDSVPVGKIIAFGGDYRLVDGVYAHQLMARQNVSKVLANKVRDGVFDMDAAKFMARRMFYENPKALFEGK